MEDIRQSVKKFILDSFLFDDNDDALNCDESFLEKGIIDSTGVLELVRFIEDEFKISVYDDEMIPENLDSVNKLSKFINDKIACSESK